MEYVFTPRGVCSSKIKVDIEDDTIRNVVFIGGCRGNTQGVGKLCVGRKVDEIISLLDGIQCRNGTSCPDQLAKALRTFKAEQQH